MIDQFVQVFPQINNCLSVCKDKNTCIFENEVTKKGDFVSAKDKYHLHIENKTKFQYYFLQNDNCIMINLKNGQCDYLVLNTKEVYFTEIKIAKGNLSNHRKEAYNQIKNTFKFYSNEITFSNEFILNALVCFPSKRRITGASQSTKRKEFKVNYNIDLKEENYILFE